MNRKFASLTLTAMLGVVFALTPSVAEAAQPQSAETQVTGMEVVGHDAAVAAAHGFVLKKNADGSVVSVPQTASAKKVAASFKTVQSPAGVVRPMNTKYGTCGTSSLFISHISGGVRIKTSYSVYATAVQQNWNVDGATTTVAWSEPFSGLNFSTTWTATHDHKVSGASSSTAGVRAGSTATLIDGTICGSYGPTDSY